MVSLLPAPSGLDYTPLRRDGDQSAGETRFAKAHAKIKYNNNISIALNYIHYLKVSSRGFVDTKPNNI